MNHQEMGETNINMSIQLSHTIPMDLGYDLVSKIPSQKGLGSIGIPPATTPESLV
jgi:hypothetical protein